MAVGAAGAIPLKCNDGDCGGRGNGGGGGGGREIAAAGTTGNGLAAAAAAAPGKTAVTGEYNGSPNSRKFLLHIGTT